MQIPTKETEAQKARQVTFQLHKGLPLCTRVRFSQEAVQAALPNSLRTIQRQMIMEIPHISGRTLDLAWHVAALIYGNDMGIPHRRSIDCVVECGFVYPCRHRLRNDTTMAPGLIDEERRISEDESHEEDSHALPEGHSANTLQDDVTGDDVVEDNRWQNVTWQGNAHHDQSQQEEAVMEDEEEQIVDIYPEDSPWQSASTTSSSSEDGRQSAASQSPTLVNGEAESRKGSQESGSSGGPVRPRHRRNTSKIPVLTTHPTRPTRACSINGQKRCHCLHRKALAATA